MKLILIATKITINIKPHRTFDLFHPLGGEIIVMEFKQIEEHHDFNTYPSTH